MICTKCKTQHSGSKIHTCRVDLFGIKLRTHNFKFCRSCFDYIVKNALIYGPKNHYLDIEYCVFISCVFASSSTIEILEKPHDKQCHLNNGSRSGRTEIYNEIIMKYFSEINIIYFRDKNRMPVFIETSHRYLKEKYDLHPM